MWKTEAVPAVNLSRDPHATTAPAPAQSRSDDPLESPPGEECGVFGVWAPGEEVARLTYFGLYALQHRGQESAGIAASNGRQILVYRDMGLVSSIFKETDLETLPGHIAVGHTRYSTTGASSWENAQPTLGPTPLGTLALAHNGNLTNVETLESIADEYRADHQHTVAQATNKTLRTRGHRDSSNDTSLITELFGSSAEESLHDAAMSLLPKLDGAFSLVF